MNKKSKTRGKVNQCDILISKKLKLRRLELGLNQDQLGIAIGVSTQQIQKYEQGTNRISGGNIKLLADFLSVPINYFFDEQECYPEISAINEVFNKLCVYYVRLEQNLQKATLSLLKVITEIKQVAKTASCY